MTRIGFIGLGVMGRPMANHLLRAGYNLAVHNRSQGKVQELVAGGAEALSPEEMAERCEAILLCLPTSVEVAEVTHEILASAPPGLIVADHSTIQPRVAQNLADRAAAGGVTFLDAPITGGEIGAINGTLSTMVGGEEAGFAKLLPVMQAFSSKVTHVGPSGCGQMTKMANQIAVSITVMAVAETLSFAEQSGLDLDKTIEVIAGGAGDSWSLRQYGPKMVARDYKPGFSIDLQLKDLGYASEAAQLAGASLPGLALAHQFVAAVRARGMGDKSVVALFDLYQALNGRADD